MPGRNTIKAYISNHYYHAYNRGWNRTEIFPATEDYDYFELLIRRCLAAAPEKDQRGRGYVCMSNTLQLNAYCLMPNHFHMLVYQHDEDSMTKFMQSICTAYTMYFNRKYKRRGPLFENRFKAVPIYSDSQLQHISRYIHLNHWHFKTWPYSSYEDYLGLRSRAWVRPMPILEIFDSVAQYEKFVLDYETTQRDNEREKKSLAKSG